MRSCDTCSKVFFSHQAKTRYCGQRCRQVAWRRTHVVENLEQSRRYEEHRPQRNNLRFKTYGITEEDYLKMLQEQDNSCAICGTKDWDIPHIDHNHATGKVRGLLCRECNLGLGKFGDSVELMLEAISYLRTS